jgi:hypothetical protein
LLIVLILFRQAGQPGTTTPLPALRDRRRLVYEIAEVVAVDFLL